MPTWKSTNKIGIAICSYGLDVPKQRQLPLLIGEVLLIQQECQHWFYGYSLTNDQQRSGIFPKNHVLIQKYEIENNNLLFGLEMILTLHEWVKAWKRIVINGDYEKYHNIRELILDIIGKYHILKSGKLTSSEIKKLKTEIIDKIDLGNKHLDLDLMIHDNEGNIINPFETSIIQYFQLHWNKAQKLRTFFRNSNDSNDITKQERYSSYLSNQNGNDYLNYRNYNDCYNFCVTLLNFICRIKQDLIIYMSIYDANSNKFITENYVVKWARTGFVREVEKINNIRVVFTDFSANDLYHKNKKLYLVCQVIRVGTMHIDHERSNKLAMKVGTANTKIPTVDELKRPCGVAVYDLNEVINNNSKGDRDEEKEIFIPFIQYSEKDSLNSLLRKVVRDYKEPTNREQGCIITIRMIISYKMQLLDKYRLYYAQYPSYIARKIGFRDIILPEDVRNDLYLTLICGEFHKGSKKSEHNIEVTVKVLDEEGNTLENCLSVDSQNAMDSVYKSVVYYHEDKPKWMETIKVVLPIEKFTIAHFKFIFKHRSSNENKDKNEKPFAISYLKLMNKDGTTLENNFYKPLIYKIDPKKYNETDKSYLSLPSCEDELRKIDLESTEQGDMKMLPKKISLSNLYTYSPRDVFIIAVNICSTKLAQNIKILSLLNWKEKKDSLEEILNNVQKLEGGEIMKFLHDVLDALFEIWMDPSTPSDYDRKIFDALVYIIKHLLQEKYIHFQEILNEYIENHFSATLIHTKLVESFKYYIQNPDLNLSYQTVTSMEFIFKFIIRSRNLYAILNCDKNKQDFELALDDLFDLFTKLMDPSEFSESNENVIKVRLGILKYFPKVITNILTIFDERKLTFRIIKLISNVPITELSVQKLACIHEIVESELFCNYPECRRKLLPVINVHLQTALLMVIDEDSPRNEKLEKCLSILGDALEILVNKDLRTIKYDIFDFVQILLSTMIETFLFIQQKPNENAHKYKLWSIILALLYQMTDYHYYEFFDKLRTNNEFENFLKDLLKTFNFATELIFPNDWSDMIYTQNIVILKAMKRVINYSKEKINFYEYSLELWNQLFLTSIKFITQKSLLVEKFSNRKKSRLENVHQDIRLEMVVLVRSLWYNLANHKSDFIPSLIGPLLEVALIPVLTIRKDTIVIFFDMFLCCFEKASITRNEMLTQLDSLITSGKGDEEFQQLMAGIFLESSANHVEEIKEVFEKFVSEISEQIEKLLIYRDVIKNEDNYEVSMSSIIELLNFYDRINRKELYINYLYKLYDLHLKLENFNEAAYILCKHSILLEWSDKPLEELLRNLRYKIYNSHRELKERLYFDIIENFNKGHLWEAGIIYCKELVQQYENEIFDYVKLANLFEKMASFYKLIISSVRIEPEYFHVTYYGNGYPKYFRNKSFIYRGKSYERLFEFTKRLQKQFPNAQLLDRLDIPKSEIINSTKQYLSVFRVDPKVSEEVKNKFLRNMVDERIIKYYQYNEISEFSFSRKLIRDNQKNERPASNEFACMWIERSDYKTAFPLPGISHRSEIVNKITYQLNPLENAIDTMEKMNEKTRMIIFRYMMDDDNSNPLHNLLMHIKGIVSSDVQGGVSKYEEAFFDQINNNEQNDNNGYEYRPEDLEKLKTLIADQIPLVDLALKIAEQKQKQHMVNQSMDGLYQYIVESFIKMRDDVEMKYGKSDLPLDMKKIIENHHKMHRLTASNAVTNSIVHNNNNSSHRNSIDGTMTLTKKSLFGRSNTSGTNTLTNTLRFRKKESRRLNSGGDSTSVYSSNANISQTQWYTDHSKKSTGNLSYISDNFMTTTEQQQQQQQQHSPSYRESKSSRISSRPNSGQFSSRASIQSQLSLYCPQSTSSMSLEDEQEEMPPPLPVKRISQDELR